MGIRDQLLRHEGLRLKPYHDTVGKLTIGVGRNLDDVGISREEAMSLLENDILRVHSEVIHALPWSLSLDRPRFEVLLNMAFNLGMIRLLGFVRFLDAVQTGVYEAAAVEMLDSKWARQVGERAQELAEIMRTGVDPFASGKSVSGGAIG